MSAPQFDKVYKLVREIPKGRVTTYGAIAKKLNMFPRTVGYALHLNPDEIKIPCHRIVDRDGRVGKGFAFGGRIEQRKRLEKEGVEFEDEQHLEIERYFIEP